MTEQKITTSELENIVLLSSAKTTNTRYTDIEKDDIRYYLGRLLEHNDMGSMNAWTKLIKHAQKIYKNDLDKLKTANLQKIEDDRLAEEARQTNVRNKVGELFVHREYIKLKITKNLELKNSILEYLEHHSGLYRNFDDLVGQFDEDELAALDDLVANNIVAIKRVVPGIGKWRVFFNYTQRTIDNYIGESLLEKENTILCEIEQTEDAVSKLNGTLEIPSFLRNKETEHNRIKRIKQLAQNRITNYAHLIEERFLKTE